MFRRISRVVRMASVHALPKKGTVRVNTGKRTETLAEEQRIAELNKDAKAREHQKNAEDLESDVHSSEWTEQEEEELPWQGEEELSWEGEEEQPWQGEEELPWEGEEELPWQGEEELPLEEEEESPLEEEEEQPWQEEEEQGENDEAEHSVHDIADVEEDKPTSQESAMNKENDKEELRSPESAMNKENDQEELRSPESAVNKENDQEELPSQESEKGNRDIGTSMEGEEIKKSDIRDIGTCTEEKYEERTKRDTIDIGTSMEEMETENRDKRDFGTGMEEEEEEQGEYDEDQQYSSDEDVVEAQPPAQSKLHKKANEVHRTEEPALRKVTESPEIEEEERVMTEKEMRLRQEMHVRECEYRLLEVLEENVHEEARRRKDEQKLRRKQNIEDEPRRRNEYNRQMQKNATPQTIQNEGKKLRFEADGSHTGLSTQPESEVNDDPKEQDIANRQCMHQAELAITLQAKEDELLYIKSKLSHHRLVFYILNSTYLSTTGQCPCCRYSDMKFCVDQCIENFYDDDFMSSYFSSDEMRLLQMKDTAEVFGTMRRMTIATNSHNMLNMTETALVSNIMWLEEELNKLQRHVITEERKLQKLIGRYTKLPELNVFKRYTALHDIIEEACMDCVDVDMDVEGQEEPRYNSREEMREREEEEY